MEFLSSGFFLTVILPALLLLGQKLIPNERLAKWGEGIGVICTLGLSRLAPKLWSRLESIFIDGLLTFVGGFVKGLRSDDK